MDADDHGTVQFHQISTRDYSNINQIGVQKNYFSGASNPKQSLLDQFGPVNPRVERTRILGQKDKLLSGSSSWVFDDIAFKSWLEGSRDSNILWIHGDPGKGKTMIFGAVMEELSLRIKNGSASDGPLAFFFCQRTDVRLSTAFAVAKGLIYTLLTQDDRIVNYLLASNHQLKREDFTFWSLWTLLQDLLENVLTEKVYLCIDALDECSVDTTELLDCIIRQANTKAQWLITSRNETYIRERLEYAGVAVHTSLELNSRHVDETVKHFITVKIEEIARIKRYRDELKDKVETHLQTNAQGTFLWVALVCKALGNMKAREVESKLHIFPPGLDDLYQQMLKRLEDIVDEDEVQLCYQLLRTAVISREPLSIIDLAYFSGLPEDFMKDSQWIEELISQCGSFLSIRMNLVYFVHQSATDFLIRDAKSEVFPNSPSREHSRLTYKCLDVMCQKLTKNICGFSVPGTLVSELSQSHLFRSIPSHLQYACKHISYHSVHSAERELYWDDSSLHLFFSLHLLHWLEALCWMRELSRGILSLLNIHGNVTGHATGIDLKSNDDESSPPFGSQFKDLLADANSFLGSYRPLIEFAPLQIYYSALLFIPSRSVIKATFINQQSFVLKHQPRTKSCWETHDRSFEGHLRIVRSIVFSSDRYYVAGGYSDGTIIIWEMLTGAVHRKLKPLTDDEGVESMAFSPDNSLFAAGFSEETVLIWEISSAAVLFHDCFDDGTHEDYAPPSVYFTKNSKHVVFGSRIGLIQSLKIANMTLKQIASLDKSLLTLRLSDDDQLVALDSDFSVHSWDVSNMEEPKHTVDMTKFERKFTAGRGRVALSSDQRFVATNPAGKLTIWNRVTNDLESPSYLQDRAVMHLSASPTRNLLACETSDGATLLWNLDTARLDTGYDHDGERSSSLAFSSDGMFLACGTFDGLVSTWYIDRKSHGPEERFGVKVSTTSFCSDRDLVAYVTDDNVIWIFETVTPSLRGKVSVEAGIRYNLAFAPDGSTLAFGTNTGGMVCLCDTKSLKLEEIDRSETPNSRHPGTVTSSTFSGDSKWLAVVFGFRKFEVLNVAKRECHLMEDSTDRFRHEMSKQEYDQLCFSADNKLIAVSIQTDLGPKVEIWEICDKTKTVTIDISVTHFQVRPRFLIYDMTFSGDKSLLAVALGRGIVITLDLKVGGTLREEQFPYQGCKMDFDNDKVVLRRRKFEMNNSNEWILLHEKKFLRLPREMQPLAFGSKGDTVILQVSKGPVVFLCFDPSKLPDMVNEG